MTFQFALGAPVTMRFVVGSAAEPPEPEKGFPSVTDDFHRVEEHMLTGTMTSDWTFTPEEG
ncbi:MAG: hypothetical protein IKN55_07745 [Oscillospiraceae bacterium]|nr:hypothetical protein [Oscillospiraceae bacterium]